MTTDESAAATPRRALIVGRGTAGRSLATDVAARGLEVVGFLDDSVVDPEVLGTLNDVNDVIEQHGVDVVYFAIPSVDAGTVRDFLATIQRAIRDVAQTVSGMREFYRERKSELVLARVIGPRGSVVRGRGSGCSRCVLLAVKVVRPNVRDLTK